MLNRYIAPLAMLAFALGAASAQTSTQRAAAAPAAPAAASSAAKSTAVAAAPSPVVVAPVPLAPAAATGTAKPSKSAVASAASRAAASTSGRARANDRIDLDAAQITGNRELPKVLYIVPWKRPELGDLLGKPVNSLLDEVLAPVDRDVFKRENRYFEALQPAGRQAAESKATPGDGPSPPPPAKPEN